MFGLAHLHPSIETIASMANQWRAFRSNQSRTSSRSLRAVLFGPHGELLGSGWVAVFARVWSSREKVPASCRLS